MKKWLSAILCVLMIAGLCFACTPSEPEDQTDSIISSEATESADTSSEDDVSSEALEDVSSEEEVSASVSSAVISTAPVSVASTASAPAPVSSAAPASAAAPVSSTAPASSAPAVTISEKEKIKSLTYNVLVGGDAADRAPGLLYIIDLYQPDTFSLSEASPMWMDAILPTLKKKYDVVFVYRDSPTTGEASPVFYLKSRFTLVDSDAFWLNETQTPYEKGWGAEYCRTCSYAVLQDKNTGKKFVHFGTHLDHVSETAQTEGMKIIVNKMKELGLPSIVSGDFNFKRNSSAYKSILNDGFLSDAYQRAAVKENASWGTFGGYGPGDGSVIDFFFATTANTIIGKYRVTEEINPELGKTFSDHLGVYIEWAIK